MKNKIIFFGNGPLADSALSVLKNYPDLEIIFHARTKEDLETVKKIKLETPSAFGVLASFGVLIKKDLLNLFEPEGILNIHPSLLPEYRGASPIESAILDGKTSFSVSVMKLVEKMDAGPVYFQTTLNNLPLEKTAIYSNLAAAGATWLAENLPIIKNLSTEKKYIIQDDKNATFCKKFNKQDGELDPSKDSAETLFRKIVAFQSFPKPHLDILGRDCIIISATLAPEVKNLIDSKNLLDSTSSNIFFVSNKNFYLKAADGNFLQLLQLQPAGKKPMDTKSFLNGLR